MLYPLSLSPSLPLCRFFIHSPVSLFHVATREPWMKGSPSTPLLATLQCMVSMPTRTRLEPGSARCSFYHPTRERDMEVHMYMYNVYVHHPTHPLTLSTYVPPLVLKARHLHNNIIMVALTGIRFA